MVVDQNLVDQRASFSYSSQQTAYPAENAVDVNRRARTWRSAGYWNIESGSNTLVIRDASGGSDLTATVAVGTYATDALFFAALKTALEAVSDSTFTITRDATTNAIKITAVLGGAATHFEIRGAAAGSANFAPILGYALTNLSGALFYVADVVMLHTEEFLIFDFGFPVSPTAALGFADRNRALRISSSATVKIQGNATNTWASPQVDETLVVADYGIGVVDRDGLGGIACRYWKLKIYDPSNSYGHIELGAFVLGTHIELDRGDAVFPLDVQEEDLTVRAYSEGGQVIAGKRAQTRTFRLSWEGITKAGADELIAVFETYGLHSVFAIVLDEDGVFSTDLMRWAKLVRFQEPPTDQLASPNNWSFQWRLREDL